MIDMKKTDRIRSVHISPDKGTKVSHDALSIKKGNLLPLQAALGYGITQSLFIAPNCLIVEGDSDRIFLNLVSDKLFQEKRIVLSPRWVITPASGIDKITAFVSLFASQKDMNVAVLVDANKKHKQRIENLHKKELIVKKKVLTYSNFIDAPSREKEADIEDVFDRNFYISIFNESFSDELGKEIDTENLKKFSRPRVVESIKAYLAENPFKSGKSNFEHYIPALHFSKNIDRLWEKMSDESKKRFEGMFEQINKLVK